jgi:hypothetical protein
MINNISYVWSSYVYKSYQAFNVFSTFRPNPMSMCIAETPDEQSVSVWKKFLKSMDLYIILKFRDVVLELY